MSCLWQLEQHTELESVPPAWKARMLPITPVLHIDYESDIPENSQRLGNTI